MKLSILACVLVVSAFSTLLFAEDVHRFQGADLRIPIGHPNAIPLDMCYQPGECDDIGRKHAADTYCQIQHFSKSVPPLLVIRADSPTRFIGAVPQADCPNQGCNTFQFIDCSN
ncbi:hypothetical protein [Paraburkholderia aromaticivorans]|uniref:hypothetical protein n=1 Tax=Paraburkholderia aromaticivorans TaxID=2026199 RepID=UPI001456173C|nr:hypothetical protein [Paraburkholderia aromaticivorans]